MSDNCYLPGCHIGMILVDPDKAGSGADLSTKDSRRLLEHDVRPEIVSDEVSLINLLIERVWEWDPDILSGWEVQTASWGYVTHRMSTYHEGML
jgi:DNA polymerase elongation subunit (family B)